MDDDAISNLFLALYKDIPAEDQFYITKPLLAHYTSLEALEKILQNNEVWFSNPLFMNDLDEVKFGVLHGVTAIKGDERIRTALKTESRYRTFAEALDYYINDFDEKHLLDTYVFCLSEHDPGNNDGMLTMWRGYGGNGRGAPRSFSICRSSTLLKTARLLSRESIMSYPRNDLGGLID
jgi:hypothetical protein